MQPEESLEKICYGKEIWKRRGCREESRREIKRRECGDRYHTETVKDREVSAAQNETEMLEERTKIKLQHTDSLLNPTKRLP